jgi:hypothetical protein
MKKYRRWFVVVAFSVYRAEDARDTKSQSRRRTVGGDLPSIVRGGYLEPDTKRGPGRLLLAIVKMSVRALPPNVAGRVDSEDQLWTTLTC